jgi:hypothetical protein
VATYLIEDQITIFQKASVATAVVAEVTEELFAFVEEACSFRRNLRKYDFTVAIMNIGQSEFVMFVGFKKNSTVAVCDVRSATVH